jgi:transposase-like protein
MSSSDSTPHAWQPPHCPNPNCKFFNQNDDQWSYKKIGFYHRQAKPHRIQRFLCLHCRRSFGRQTFSTTYWQRLPELDQKLFMRTTGGMANRQIARDLRVAPETVNRHLSRLGRHCLLFHWQKMQHQKPPTAVVIDGFESFEYSQYHPLHHHLAVEPRSGLFLYFSDSELRRKGRMTAYQKRRRQQLEQRDGRPDPKAVAKDMGEVLSVCLAGQTVATVFSDDHRAYRRSVQQVRCRVQHEVTSSRERRDARNPLWEVNLLELLIRHGSANHRRETIAWSKRRQSSAERLAILLVGRNYVNWRYERNCVQKPAMLAGVVAGKLSVAEVLAARIFRQQVELPPRWADYYDRRVVTRALPRNREHRLKYAY